MFYLILISKSIVLFCLLLLFYSVLFLFHGCRSEFPVDVHASGVFGSSFLLPVWSLFPVSFLSLG